MPLRLALAALVLLVLAPLAFWPAYLSNPGAADIYTHAHAALGTGWLLLLVVQPLLIEASHPAWHRLLGRLGVIVGAVFVVSGILLAHHSIARMSLEQFAREGRYVYLPLAMAAIFGAALALAVVWRRIAPVHGRFMAATLLTLLDPLFARLLFFYGPPLPAQAFYQAPGFGVAVIVLLAMLLTLPGKVHGRRAFLLFAAGASAILAGYFVIPHTPLWLSFAAWFRTLPLT